MSSTLPQLIDGEWRQSQSREAIDVTDPATQAVIARAPKATPEEIEAAVASARQAFLAWREVPAPERARLMLRYQHLLKEHHDELAEILARETGKTFADAKGDVWRGIEVAEQAANICSLMMGETVENVARDIDTASWIQPLGVCVGITPFNFPAMIPLWMFPLAIACGNTFVLKPSEQDPMTPNRLAELFIEAGAPKGVLQVLHGGREVVDALITHPEVRAISFVGSVAVGQHIYRTGTDHLKRVQAFAGAKNHMVIMPDAPKDQVLSNLVGASCGAAGQRCMAISVAVFVGESKAWIGELAEQMAALRPGYWSDTGAAYGPVISPQAKARVLSLIAQGKAEGARVPGRRFGLHSGRLPRRQLGRPDPLPRRHPADGHLPRGNLRPGAGVHRGRDPGRGHRPGQRQPLRQRHQHLHPLRRRRAALPACGGGRPGRHQRAHPGAAAVLLLHRLEGFLLWRPARLRQAGGALLHRDQDGHQPLVRRQPGERAQPDHQPEIRENLRFP